MRQTDPIRVKTVLLYFHSLRRVDLGELWSTSISLSWSVGTFIQLDGDRYLARIDTSLSQHCKLMSILQKYI